MKLFRFGPAGEERPGVLSVDGKHWDVSAFGEDYGEDFFRTGGLERLTSWIASSGPAVELRDVVSLRFAPVVARPSKIVCVGLNYRDHAAETGAALPREPKIFMKATTALAGVFDPLRLPRGSRKTDYEVELAVVMGSELRYGDEAEAFAAVFGYTIMNDYSEREFQKEREGQWVKGKSADGFAPLGPYLVPSELLEPGELPLWLSVDGEVRQESNTREMVFSVGQIVSSISQYMTLLPGDVIATGTPAGVGLGRTPQAFLEPGDIVRYGIEGIGEAVQVVLAPDAEEPDSELLLKLRASQRSPT